MYVTVVPCEMTRASTHKHRVLMTFTKGGDIHFSESISNTYTFISVTFSHVVLRLFPTYLGLISQK